MNLQFFADGDGTGADGSNGDGSGGEGSGQGTLSFDDFLKEEGNQAEFDRRLNKAIETAVKNAIDSDSNGTYIGLDGFKYVSVGYSYFSGAKFTKDVLIGKEKLEYP